MASSARFLFPCTICTSLIAGAAIVMLGLTGIASSYARMLLKVSRYDELRTQKDELKNRYTRLEEVAKERDIQVASLGLWQAKFHRSTD